jgi:hypothetical protein
MAREDLGNRAQEYARLNNLTIGEQLGYGDHGIVFAAKFQAKSGQCAV